MRESRSCGSERGAPSNGRPYREKPSDNWSRHTVTGASVQAAT
jgi:hypothetical protein